MLKYSSSRVSVIEILSQVLEKLLDKKSKENCTFNGMEESLLEYLIIPQK